MFTTEQQQYLQGFVAGSDAARGLRGLPTFAATLANKPELLSEIAIDASPAGVHRQAQDRTLAAGRTLTPEEQAKRDKSPWDMWDEMRANAVDGKFPKGTDVFLYKFHGLFFVAPAQNAFMTRLRFAGGIVTSAQAFGVADIADQWGGGYVDVTTRANLQIREICAERGLDVLTALIDLGIVNRGAGADNIRNITGSPTAGIDSQELIDTRPLCREMHHYILQHRELFGLPRKFNIAFDGGGRVSALTDTNDIGFAAVRVAEGEAVPAGIYFRLELGGITGHLDFARDAGVLLQPNECLPVAVAILHLFIEHGDRTDRKKARLKYVLDRVGHERFVEMVEEQLKRKLPRVPLTNCATRPGENRLGHVGVHSQKQTDKYYVGIVLPVGRMTGEQLRGLARLADQYGRGELRLTVWQNLLLPHISAADLPAVVNAIERMGLHWSATNSRAGLVACTGSGGCKFAASNTKRHALAIAEYLDARVRLDQPLNIHVTGCHHSCAQHYIGDIGLLATKVPIGEELVEGYHLFVGGGYGADQHIGRELFRNLPFDTVPETIHRLAQSYLAQRLVPTESFREFVRRMPTEQLVAWGTISSFAGSAWERPVLAAPPLCDLVPKPQPGNAKLESSVS